MELVRWILIVGYMLLCCKDIFYFMKLKHEKEIGKFGINQDKMFFQSGEINVFKS